MILPESDRELLTQRLKAVHLAGGILRVATLSGVHRATIYRIIQGKDVSSVLIKAVKTTLARMESQISRLKATA